MKVVSEMLGNSRVGISMDLYQPVTSTMQQESAVAFDQLLSDPLVGSLAVNPADSSAQMAPVGS